MYNRPHSNLPCSTLAAAAAALLTSLALFSSGNALAADDPPAKSVNEELVDTLETLAGGRHAGYRSNHAKGIVVSGTFMPATNAATLSKAAHLQKTSVPVIVRFSDTTGVPNIPDADPNASPHGIAIRFQLPDGAFTDIVSISFNGFPVATPEEFLEFLKAIAASGPDTPSPKPVEQFLGTHPKALAFATAPKPAPRSFATLSYFGVNAFQFTNAKGVSRYGRYRIIPVSGDKSLSDAEAAKMPPNYLMEELPARLAKAPAKFRLSVQLAQEGDSLTDGSSVWPEGRPQILLGTLTLRKVLPDSAEAEKKLTFNPLILTDGIAPSADPILLARPGAYAVSVGRRFAN